MVDERVGRYEDGRPVGAVLRDMVGNVEHMVQGEIRVAKIEMFEEFRERRERQRF